jgi:hypothetical protein
MNALSRWRWFWGGLSARRHLLVAAGVLGAVLLLVCFNPVQHRWFPPCPFKMVTGLYCPGCGSTRALHHLLHGRIGAAFGYNGLMVASLPLLFVNSLSRWLPGRWRGLLDEKKLSPWQIGVIFVVVVLFWVLRNIQGYPFDFLAPHG